MKRLVLSLGGSVLIPSINENRIAQYVPILRHLGMRFQLYIVVGGGGEARQYIQAAREVGADEAVCDEIGILVTRLNATLLAAALGEDAFPVIPLDQASAMRSATAGKTVVMGGITPAQTTDAVAAVLAERVHADLFINLTSVEGVYSADPKLDPSAVRFKALSPAELIQIVERSGLHAGSNTVIDIVAARVTERSHIPLLVLDGREPENLYSAVFKGVYTGTMICNPGEDPLPF